MWALLKKIASRFRRQPVTVKLRADDDLVTMERTARDGALSFSWNDVEEIRTFKRDFLTTDDIRLAFRVSDLWYEISEKDEGFMPLAEIMLNRFPSIPEDWYIEVMQAPFTTNQRTLWSRAGT